MSRFLGKYRRTECHGKACVFGTGCCVLVKSECLSEPFAKSLAIIERASKEKHLALDLSALRKSRNGLIHHRLIYNLMKGLAKKSLDYHRRIEITSKRSTREKLLAYLAACAREAGRDSFEIPFDRQELADYLEVDRSGLSAEIGKLKREGVIDTRKNWFRLM